MKIVRRIILTMICLGSCLWAEAQLPADDFFPGWQRSGRSHHFIGKDLFNHINGGAELFLEFGFVDLTVQRYKHQDVEIGLELYRMTEPEAALGIYLMKCGLEETIAGLAMRHSYNRFQTAAVKGAYFCLVNNYSGDAAHAPVMARLLELALVTVPDADAAAIFAHLPQQGLIRGSERILRGAYGLQPLFTLGEGDILKLGGKVSALYADYSDRQDRYSQMVALYPDSAAAAAAWSNLVQCLDPYLQVIAQNDSALVFRDYQQEYGRVEWRGDRIRIFFHLKEAPASGGL